MIDATLFLWVNGVIITLLLAFLGILLRQQFQMGPLCSLANRIQAKALDHWLEDRGLSGNAIGQKTKPNTEHHSLSPDKAMRRDQLVQVGKIYGLSNAEANELQALLQEDARNDFTNGIFNALAFALLMFAIGAIIKSLSK